MCMDCARTARHALVLMLTAAAAHDRQVMAYVDAKKQPHNAGGSAELIAAMLATFELSDAATGTPSPETVARGTAVEAQLAAISACDLYELTLTLQEGAKLFEHTRLVAQVAMANRAIDGDEEARKFMSAERVIAISMAVAEHAARVTHPSLTDLARDAASTSPLH